MRVNDTTGPSAASPRAAITFDVDGIQRDPFAQEPTADERAQLLALSHEVMLPRIAAWLRGLDVRATFFSIGTDITRHPRIYQQLAADGHEIANHSHGHLRDFSRQPAEVVRAEIREGHRVIERTVGVPAVGFRSPGYTVSPVVIQELTDFGYAYDASLIPSWSYTSLKQAFRLLGGSQYRTYLVAQSYRCASAPRQPYRVSATDIYRPSAGAALTEIPLTTLGPLQFPYVHGLTFRLPSSLQEAALKGCLRQPFFSFSFHDLEFADQRDFGGLPASSMTAPHLVTRVESRLAQLGDAITRARRTHRFGTMRESVVMAEQPGTVYAGA